MEVPTYKTEEQKSLPQVETSNDVNLTEIADNQQDIPSSVYFLRIAIAVFAILSGGLIERYLELNEWAGNAFFVGIIGAWIYASFKTKFFGSETERRIGDFIYTLTPWVVLAILILAVIARYNIDRTHP